MPIDQSDSGNGRPMEFFWQQLDGSQRLVLSSLATCFAASTGTELLTLICELGLERDAFQTAIDSLCNYSLIHDEDGRWSVSESVHSFIKMALGESVWNTTRRAVVTGCMLYANTHNGRSQTDYALLDIERTNLLGAARWAAEHAMHAEVNQFAFDLVANSQYLHQVSYMNESLVLLEAGVAAAHSLEDKSAQSAHLNHMGIAYTELDQVEQAIDCYQQSLKIAREIGDRLSEGNSHGNLGSAYHHLGQLECAIEHHQQALTIHHDVGDLRGEGFDLYNIGMILEKQGKIEEASQHIEQARAIFVEIKAPLVGHCDQALSRMRSSSSTSPRKKKRLFKKRH